jgi:hypothetical protein
VNPKNEFFDINFATVTAMPQCHDAVMTGVYAPQRRDGASWNDGYAQAETVIFSRFSIKTDKMVIPVGTEPPTY